MKQYETAFLISPKLTEEEIEALISQMAGVISQKKGKMVREDRWGKRKLAYSIKRFDEAFYVFFLYEGDPEIPFELERRFRQTESILRFLTLKKDARKDIRKKGKRVSKTEESIAPLREEKTEGAEDIEEESSPVKKGEKEE